MSPHTRRLAATGAVMALTLAVPGAAVSASDVASGHRSGDQVDRIELPLNWQPEGITTDGKVLYAGSLVDGRLLKADPRSGMVRILPRSATGSPAVGLDHDRRRDALWVAGGPTGQIRVHSERSGKLLRTYTMPAATGGRFVNDLVVTRKAVYATDSFNAALGVVRLHGKGLPASGEAEVLTVGGDYVQQPGFNLNGIVKHEGKLLAVQSGAGVLWQIDRKSGEATAVDLGGYDVTNGDGLELDHDVLYVVRNQNNLVAALELDDDGMSAELVEEIMSSGFDVPTTAAQLRHSLYVVNARFRQGPPEEMSWITRVDDSR